MSSGKRNQTNKNKQKKKIKHCNSHQRTWKRKNRASHISLCVMSVPAHLSNTVGNTSLFSTWEWLRDIGSTSLIYKRNQNEIYLWYTSLFINHELTQHINQPTKFSWSENLMCSTFGVEHILLLFFFNLTLSG